MELNDIKNLYHKMKERYDEVTVEDLIDELSSSNELAVIEYHYSILKNQENKNLFYDIRGCFDKHGEAGKQFLLSKIKTEKDADLKAEALFLLGTMDCFEIKPLAIDFLNQNDFKSQYYGIIVIGWLGKKEDISIIEKELLNNSNEELRAYAATSLRQIFFNHPKLKDEILLSYHRALKQEKSSDVLLNIIACVQDLLRKKFGVKESQYGEMSGDALSAKEKATKYLDTIFK